MSDQTARENALMEVSQEMEKQGEKYDQSHDDALKAHDWLAIILRETAEAAFPRVKEWRYQFRQACRKVAAVSINAMMWADKDSSRPM